jgi:hypothetical protein
MAYALTSRTAVQQDCFALTFRMVEYVHRRHCGPLPIRQSLLYVRNPHLSSPSLMRTTVAFTLAVSGASTPIFGMLMVSGKLRQHPADGK